MPRKHHSAIYDKYNDRRFKLASAYVEAEMRKNFRLPEPAIDRKTTLDQGHWKQA
jgi:hypothetical protein